MKKRYTKFLALTMAVFMGIGAINIGPTFAEGLTSANMSFAEEAAQKGADILSPGEENNLHVLSFYFSRITEVDGESTLEEVTVPIDITVTGDDAITPPSIQDVEGYEFVGWDKEIPDRATEDMEFHAVYQKIEDNKEANEDSAEELVNTSNDEAPAQNKINNAIDKLIDDKDDGYTTFNPNDYVDFNLEDALEDEPLPPEMLAESKVKYINIVTPAAGSRWYPTYRTTAQKVLFEDSSTKNVIILVNDPAKVSFLENFEFKFGYTETLYNDGRPVACILYRYKGNNESLSIPAKIPVICRKTYVSNGVVTQEDFAINLPIIVWNKDVSQPVATTDDKDVPFFTDTAYCGTMTFEAGVQFGEPCPSIYDANGRTNYSVNRESSFPDHTKVSSVIKDTFKNANVKNLIIKGTRLHNTCNMFEGCKAESINMCFENGKNWTKNGEDTTLEASFQNCPNLKTLKLTSYNNGTCVLQSGFKRSKMDLLDLSNCKVALKNKDMTYFFYKSQIKELKMWPGVVEVGDARSAMEESTFNDAQIKDILSHIRFGSNAYVNMLCASTPNLKNLDLSNRTDLGANVLSCKQMFLGCSNLETLVMPKTAYLTNTETGEDYLGGAKGAYGMFNGCSKLRTIGNMQFFKPGAKAGSLHDMFNNCKALEEIDISGIKGSNIPDYANFFNGCNALAQIKVPVSLNKDVTLPSTFCRLVNGKKSASDRYKMLPKNAASTFTIVRDRNTIFAGTIPINNIDFGSLKVRKVYFNNVAIWGSYQ